MSRLPTKAAEPSDADLQVLAMLEDVYPGKRLVITGETVTYHELLHRLIETRGPDGFFTDTHLTDCVIYAVPQEVLAMEPLARGMSFFALWPGRNCTIHGNYVTEVADPHKAITAAEMEWIRAKTRETLKGHPTPSLQTEQHCHDHVQQAPKGGEEGR